MAASRGDGHGDEGREPHRPVSPQAVRSGRFLPADYRMLYATGIATDHLRQNILLAARLAFFRICGKICVPGTDPACTRPLHLSGDRWLQTIGSAHHKAASPPVQPRPGPRDDLEFWIVGCPMEFSFGAAVLLLSMFVLAILARLSAMAPNSVLLRGELMPALLAVLIAAGLLFGVLLMVVGGESYFASRSLEALVIIGFTGIAIFGIHKFVNRGHPENPA